MNQIISPLQPGMQGSAVADLQDALSLLIERQLIKTFSPPNRIEIHERLAFPQCFQTEQAQLTFYNVSADSLL